MAIGELQLEESTTTAGICVIADDPMLSNLLVDHITSDGAVFASSAEDLDRDLRVEHDIVVAIPPRDLGTFVSRKWTSIIASVPSDLALVIIALPSMPLRSVVFDRPATAGLVVLNATSVESFRHIRTAIGVAAKGERAIDGAFRDAGLPVRDDGVLSSTERAVLRFIGEGLSNTAIASELFISQRTVEGHIRSIFSKLSLADRPEVNRRVLAALAARTVMGGGR